MKSKKKPARVHSSHFKDIQAISIFKDILASHQLVLPDLREMDTYPNIDGYLELLDMEKNPCGKLEAQVKTLNLTKTKGKVSYAFKNYKFLTYCKIDRILPVLLICVDIKKRVAYWEHITPHYVDKLAGKTVVFSKENVISLENTDYYPHWLRISDNRITAIQEYEKRNMPVPAHKTTTSKKAVSPQTIEKAKQQFQTLFIDIDLKYKYYYAFIELLEPYSLSKQNQAQRTKVRKLFDITEAQETDFIGKMEKEGSVKIVGDFCMVEDTARAKELQKEMIEKEAINIKSILKLFT